MMAPIRQFFLRILSVFRNGHDERELRREMESHLALLEDDFMANGMTRSDAKLAARKAIGGVEQAKERHRDARMFRWLADVPRDVSYALRSLSKNPSFTAAAVLTLAIGIGATTAIYSVVDTVLLRPLPFTGSDRIVAISEPENPRGTPGINYHAALDWRARSSRLEDLSTLTFNPKVIMRTRDGTVRLTAGIVSTNYFQVLGVRPALGRLFDRQDDSNRDVIVITDGTWRSYFHSDPSAVGSVVEMRGSLGQGPSNLGAQASDPVRLLTVAGVLPPEFDTYGNAFEFYLPMFQDNFGRPPGVTIRARLRDGVSLTAAQEEANVIGNAIRPPRPATAPALTMPRFRVSSVKDDLVEPIRPALRVFLVAVGVVLLIVCANVANLLMARGTARAREIAVRLAIGASRPRVMRQILTECLVLAGIGGALGALLGAAGVALIKQLATINAQGVFRIVFGGNLLPRLQEVAVDGRVLLIASTLSLIASVLFGVLPAWQLSRVSQLQALGARSNTGSRRDTRARTALVVSQLVLATMLLVGAGLLLNSFISLSRVEKGYDPSNVVAFQLVLPAEYATERKAATIESLLAALRSKTEVAHAGFAYAGILLGLQDTVGYFVPPGRTFEEMQSEQEKPRLKSLSPGYLETMGVPLLSGRYLDDRDASGPVGVVVNRTVAKRFFGDANPIGQTIIWRTGQNLNAELRPFDAPLRIVGVVEDIRQGRVAVPAYAEIFMDYRQVRAIHERMKFPKGRIEQISFGFMSFGVKTRDNPAAFIPAVRDAVRAVDANASLDAIHTMDEMVGYSTARQRFYAVLLGIFAAVAGLLAAIGIYGVLAYAVVQRTQEIGVRMALGAERRQVMALILRRGVVVGIAGIAIGLAGAFAAARYMQSMLFGVEARDPFTFATVAIMFAVIAVTASYLPARRATKVDPMVALRAE
jgi:putative ABC transport system permease protein